MIYLYQISDQNKFHIGASNTYNSLYIKDNSFWGMRVLCSEWFIKHQHPILPYYSDGIGVKRESFDSTSCGISIIFCLFVKLRKHDLLKVNHIRINFTLCFWYKNLSRTSSIGQDTQRMKGVTWYLSITRGFGEDFEGGGETRYLWVQFLKSFWGLVDHFLCNNLTRRKSLLQICNRPCFWIAERKSFGWFGAGGLLLRDGIQSWAGGCWRRMSISDIWLSREDMMRIGDIGWKDEHDVLGSLWGQVDTFLDEEKLARNLTQRYSFYRCATGHFDLVLKEVERTVLVGSLDGGWLFRGDPELGRWAVGGFLKGVEFWEMVISRMI